EVYDTLKQRLKEYYLTRVEKEDPDFVKFEVRGGIAWLEILRVARKENADMIVMGPYTVRGSILEYVSNGQQLGSTAQKVSLRARCPVSIVTSPKQRLAFEAVEKRTLSDERGI
ncbi:MAG: universal stress protein, partial [Desulfobacterales bacterium]